MTIYFRRKWMTGDARHRMCSSFGHGSSWADPDGPANQRLFDMMSRGLARSIKIHFWWVAARPCPANHISKFSRPGSPRRHHICFKSPLGPARPGLTTHDKPRCRPPRSHNIKRSHESTVSKFSLESTVNSAVL